MKQTETISIAEFKNLAKQGRVGKARNGDKAKEHMEDVIRRYSIMHLFVYKKEFKFSNRKFKFDYAIVVWEDTNPYMKIAIEYEGLMSEKSGHTTVTGYTNNCTKYNMATVLGWKLLRYTALNYKDLESDLNKLLKQ